MTNRPRKYLTLRYLEVAGLSADDLDIVRQQFGRLIPFTKEKLFELARTDIDMMMLLYSLVPSSKSPRAWKFRSLLHRLEQRIHLAEIRELRDAGAQFSYDGDTYWAARKKVLERYIAKRRRLARRANLACAILIAREAL